MEAEAYLSHLSDELNRFAAVLEAAVAAPELWTQPVPSCPGWDLREVTEHTGTVHRRTSARIRDGRSGGTSTIEFPHPGAELWEWFVDGGRNLVDALDHPPQKESWTFDPTDHTIGFWQRRQAHETLIHRWDAETAIGRSTDVPAELAADGVAEVFDVMVRLRVVAGHLTLPVDAVTFRTTDTGDSWTLGGLTPGRRPVATVSATAADLDLALWKRRPMDRLRIDGEAEQASALLAASLTP